MPRRGLINAAFIVAILCTVIDATFSFLVIDVYGSATEGNAWLDNLGAAIGFGNAMILRGLVGVALLSLLYGLTFTRRRGRSLAARGLLLMAALLTALALYQVGGLIYTLSYFPPA